MLVGNEDGIDAVQVLANRCQPLAQLEHTQPGVHQNPRIFSCQEGGIAAAAARQDAELDRFEDPPENFQHTTRPCETESPQNVCAVRTVWECKMYRAYLGLRPFGCVPESAPDCAFLGGETFRKRSTRFPCDDADGGFDVFLGYPGAQANPGAQLISVQVVHVDGRPIPGANISSRFFERNAAGAWVACALPRGSCLPPAPSCDGDVRNRPSSKDGAGSLAAPPRVRYLSGI